MLVSFPLGLIGLDFLGWGITMGGLIIGIYSYKNTFPISLTSNRKAAGRYKCYTTRLFHLKIVSNHSFIKN
jgi:hypothetical protein